MIATDVTAAAFSYFSLFIDNYCLVSSEYTQYSLSSRQYEQFVKATDTVRLSVSIVTVFTSLFC